MTAQIPHSLNIIKEEEILLQLKKDREWVSIGQEMEDISA